MVEKIHPLTDQGNRRYEQTTIERDGAIFAHPAPGDGSEVIAQIVRRRTNAFHS
jgi:hypothetical protein